MYSNYESNIVIYENHTISKPSDYVTLCYGYCGQAMAIKVMQK